MSARIASWVETRTWLPVVNMADVPASNFSKSLNFHDFTQL